MAAFVAAAREAGATLPFVAGVAVYTDERSARVLQRFPGLQLDEERGRAGAGLARPGGGRHRGGGRGGRLCWAVDGVVGRQPVRDGLGPGEDDGARVKAAVATELEEADA